MIKVAVPTRGNEIDDHFGQCETYTVFSTDANKKIISSEILPSPQGCGCKSNIASILKEKGVSIMLAGNMGEGAVNVLNNFGIKVYRGCSGDVKSLVEQWINGTISDSEETCLHHDHRYNCSH
jgi:predicted Fe-Mo cluster-binding NifX family protein